MSRAILEFWGVVGSVVVVVVMNVEVDAVDDSVVEVVLFFCWCCYCV